MSLRETLDALQAAGKRVVVVGLGVSGVESARFLKQKGLEVAVVEKLSEEKFKAASKFASQIPSLVEAGIVVHYGIDGEKISPLLADAGLVVVSPGVSLESSIVGAIKRQQVAYISELELGVQLHGGESIVVTGSNGKSSTASLIDHILHRAGVSSYLCGNIGRPVIAHESLLAGQVGDRGVLVVEGSSYQLEACTVLKPRVSVVLNISENHLERHGSLERYAAAKGRALRLQSEDDLAVINGDDPVALEMASSCRARLGVFGTRSESDLSKLSPTWARISYLDNAAGAIVVSLKGAREAYTTDRVKLVGPHNRYNMAAAILVAREMGVDKDTIQEALESFVPLEHRLEVVWSDGERVIINDSKSTTVAASQAALTAVVERFPTSSVVMMIGGLSKAGSWQPLFAKISSQSARRISVICFGKDGPLLASHCRNAGISHDIAPNLREATRQALQGISKEGVALLSPGCASFDEFVDFENRGREFKRYVLEDQVTILQRAV